MSILNRKSGYFNKVRASLTKLANTIDPNGITPSEGSFYDEVSESLERIADNYSGSGGGGGGGGDTGMDIICTCSQVGKDTVFTTEKTAGEIRDMLLADTIPARFITITDDTDINQKYGEAFLVTGTNIWYYENNPSVVDYISVNILDVSTSGSFIPSGDDEQTDWTKPMTYTRSGMQ